MVIPNYFPGINKFMGMKFGMLERHFCMVYNLLKSIVFKPLFAAWGGFENPNFAEVSLHSGILWIRVNLI